MLKSKLDQLKAKDGFTIIEVIIVLVIAAIIMLAVFLVVPQLQRTQRNSRRQNDARRVLAAAEQFAANNGGTFPTTTNCPTSTTLAAGNCTPITDITGTVNSPANAAYDVDPPATNFSAVGAMGLGTAVACTNNAPVTGSSTYVVVVALETAGGTTPWCVAD